MWSGEFLKRWEKWTWADYIWGAAFQPDKVPDVLKYSSPPYRDSSWVFKHHWVGAKDRNAQHAAAQWEVTHTVRGQIKMSKLCKPAMSNSWPSMAVNAVHPWPCTERVVALHCCWMGADPSLSKNQTIGVLLTLCRLKPRHGAVLGSANSSDSK